MPASARSAPPPRCWRAARAEAQSRRRRALASAEKSGGGAVEDAAAAPAWGSASGGALSAWSSRLPARRRGTAKTRTVPEGAATDRPLSPHRLGVAARQDADQRLVEVVGGVADALVDPLLVHLAGAIDVLSQPLVEVAAAPAVFHLLLVVELDLADQQPREPARLLVQPLVAPRGGAPARAAAGQRDQALQRG